MPDLHCDTIQRYVQDELSASELAEFEEHLTQCGLCRSSLDARAGRDGVWSAVRDTLRQSAERPQSGARRQGLLRSDGPSLDDAGLRRLLAGVLGATDDPASLGRLGSYEISGAVGRGGMGVVLRALDSALGRRVAIKLLDPSLAGVASARVRFAREARSMAAISHDHVVPVFAVDEHGGVPFFVMEYIVGGNLEVRLANEGQLGVLATLRIALQLAHALEAAHNQGVIHRDIKPANILLDRGVERIRVTDFGLASVAHDAPMTRSGMVAGTPEYMSPEQVRGEACDGRSDLFALGAVMHAMLSGHSPFRSSSMFGVMHAVVHDEPPPLRERNPEVPGWLEAFVEKLLAKDARDRFQSAREVAGSLEQEVRQLQDPANAKAPERPWLESDARQWKARAPHVAVLAGSIGLALLAGAFGQGRSGPAAPAEQGALRPEVSSLETSCAALIAAIERRDRDRVTELLRSTDPNTDCPWPLAQGSPVRRSPLVTAAKVGDVGIGQSLLDAGARVDHASFGECTPLMVAAKSGHRSFVAMLVARGASLDVGISGFGTALSIACKWGRGEIARDLVTEGADLEAFAWGTGTPLMRAIKAGEQGIALWLMEEEVSLVAGVHGVGSPLTMAVKYGRPELLKVLLARGADPNDRRVHGAANALMTACQAGDPELARLLLDAGADPRELGSIGGIVPSPVVMTPEMKALLPGYVR